MTADIGTRPATRPATALPFDSAVHDLPVHPAAELFPLLPELELHELADDIRNHGLLTPVIVHDGRVLDGRNRLAACRIVGVNPTVEQWRPRAGETPLGFVLSSNLMRRHLTVGQRAALAVQVEAFLAQEARERVVTGAQKGGLAAAAKRTAALFTSPDDPTVVSAPRPVPAGPVTPGAPVADPFQQPGAGPVPSPASAAGAGAGAGAAADAAAAADDAAAAAAAGDAWVGDPWVGEDPAGGEPQPPSIAAGRSRDLAAKALRVSSGYVGDAKNLQRADPGAFQKVLSGEMTLPQAQRYALDEATAKGLLERSKIRPGVKRTAEVPRRKIKPVKKFGKVESSRVTLSCAITFGSPKVAEDVLHMLDRDPRVLSMTVTSDEATISRDEPVGANA